MRGTDPSAVNIRLIEQTVAELGGVTRDKKAMIDKAATQVRLTALTIMQGYLGPERKVIDKRALYYALVQALTEARQQGRQEIA